jgi:DHA2 family multidrug resistance protein
MNTTATLPATHTDSKKWFIVITIMLVAILEVLDSTIVNVALPAMMPSLGANQEQVTWVLTSYVVAAAVMLPLTGFLSNRLGQKKLLLIDIVGFCISSVLCGMSSSLTIMVVLRLCQGAFGAALIPISQAVLRQTFPVEEQGKAMAIWGLGIMVAPVLGPTLGGFITEHASWRWIFYINLPICLIGFIMTMVFIEDTKRVAQKIDYLGMFLMFIGIGSLQVFLDQGNSKNWFDSNSILLLCIASIVSIIWFIARSLKHKAPVITMSIFKDRNFTICTLSLAIFAASVFGFLTLEPIMLESVFNYTALIAGLTLAPMGLASAIMMIASAGLLRVFSAKSLIASGVILCSIGLFYMAHLDLQASQANFLLANTLLGAGMGLFMVPITTYSLITLSPNRITEGAGLFAYGRMLGSSIGISLLSTLVSRETQINWNRFGGHINRFNNNLHHWLSAQHLTLTNPRTYGMLANTVHRSASMVAFVDAYILIAGILMLTVPLIFFLETVDMSSAEFSGH